MIRFSDDGELRFGGWQLSILIVLHIGRFVVWGYCRSVLLQTDRFAVLR